MNKEWSEANKNMQSLLKKITFSEGINELIGLRNALIDEINSWKYELDPRDYSQMPFPNAEGYHSKTIAYSLWHIMRIEDIVVNSLILNRTEVLFSGGFDKSTKSCIITTGNELVKNGIADFSRQLDLTALFRYAQAVKNTTDEWLMGISYDDLKRKFTDEDRDRLRSLNVVSTDKNAEWLIDYWCGKDIKGLIKMPLSRHWIMHVEAAVRIKDKVLKTKAAMPRLLSSGMTSAGITYYIYEDTDGSVFAETLCSRHCPIAVNACEFGRLSMAEIEKKIYNAEMSAAR